METRIFTLQAVIRRRPFIAIHTLLAAVVIALAVPCPGNDLDDGIAIDDNIETYDRIKLDLNLRYIERDARSRSAIKKQDIQKLGHTGSPEAIMGGVKVEPGAETGDIIVIFEGDENLIISE